MKDLMYFLFWLAVLAVSLWVSYSIAMSDLPDWVKFWLLS